MSRLGKLTYLTNEKRWTKKLNGKALKVGLPTLRKLYPQLVKADTEAGSKRAAEQWWIDKLKSEQPQLKTHEAFWQDRLREYKARVNWLVEHGEDATDEQESVNGIEDILAQVTLPAPPVYDWVRNPEMEQLWRDRLKSRAKRDDLRLSALVRRYLDARSVDQIAQSTLNGIETCLGKLVDFCSDCVVSEVTGLTLTEFKTEMLRKNDDKWASEIVSSSRAFLTWCWEVGLIEELPRNINSKSLKIKIPTKEVTVWERNALKEFYGCASDELKLVALLALNCGMTAVDVAELHAKDGENYDLPRIDWNKKQIIRRRVKTQKHKSVPLVTYDLWPETFSLLKKLGNKSGRTLTNRNGNPLTIRGTRNDTIGTNFRRLRERMDKEWEPISNLRNTSSSEMDNNAEYARYIPHFLGHSPRGIQQRHYVKPSDEQFSACLRWLRLRFSDIIKVK